MMNKGKKHFSYPMTFGFILICLLLYVALVWVSVGYLWPNFMTGGEPLPDSFFSNPDSVVLAGLQAQFLGYYLLFAIFTGVLLMISYLAFALFWNAYPQHFPHNGHRAKWTVFLWNATAMLFVWNHLFRISDKAAVVALIVSDALYAVIAILFFWNLLRTLIQRRRFHDEKSRRTLRAWADFFGGVFNIGLAFFSFKPLEYLYQGSRVISDILHTFVQPDGNQYMLIAALQFGVAFVPLIPLLYLWLFLRFCMPRNIGYDIRSCGKIHEFYCMDKERSYNVK